MTRCPDGLRQLLWRLERRNIRASLWASLHYRPRNVPTLSTSSASSRRLGRGHAPRTKRKLPHGHGSWVSAQFRAHRPEVVVTAIG